MAELDVTRIPAGPDRVNGVSGSGGKMDRAARQQRQKRRKRAKDDPENDADELEPDEDPIEEKTRGKLVDERV